MTPQTHGSRPHPAAADHTGSEDVERAQTDPATARALLRSTQEILSPALRTAVARLDTANRRVVDYHLGFAAADGTISSGPAGKGIRGALAVLSARAVGGPDECGVAAGVAVELTHGYSLLHDDIVDRDTTRRHRPAAWTVFGTPAALLAGDAMAALAGEVLAEPGTAAAAAAVRSLAAATRRMLAGQSADIAFERRDSVSVSEARRMVADKTGALLSCAAALGAELAGEAPAEVPALAEFGAHLGMAFQLVDDILGIWGAEEVTGKPVASDLSSRKKSLPVVAALAAGGADADRLRALYAHPDPLTIEQLADAAAAVQEAGGRQWAEREADRETASALAVLDRMHIDGEVRSALRALTETLGRRDH